MLFTILAIGAISTACLLIGIGYYENKKRIERQFVELRRRQPHEESGSVVAIKKKVANR